MRAALEWRRWNQWAAHLYVDGKQVCSTQHRMKYPLRAANKLKPETGVPPLVALGPHGVPFGRTCQVCLKEWQRRGR